MEGKERRLQPRVEVKWPVTMLTSEGAIQGETRDISMQGAYIYVCLERQSSRCFHAGYGPGSMVQQLSGSPSR
jgi:hypothetical protein